MLRLRADVPEEDCAGLLADLAKIRGVHRVTSTAEETNGKRIVLSNRLPFPGRLADGNSVSARTARSRALDPPAQATAAAAEAPPLSPARR